MASINIPEQKVIMCGEYGVGKSSIFRRFASNSFLPDNNRKSSIGLDRFEKIYTSLDGNSKIQLWDTGGMERVASLTTSYYKFAEGALLVYALDNPASFHILSQHILDIALYAETAKIYLCGNKIDLINSRNLPHVTDQDIEQFCEQCRNVIVSSYKISCKTGEGIDEMFADIAANLLSNKSKHDLLSLKRHGFTLSNDNVSNSDNTCAC